MKGNGRKKTIHPGDKKAIERVREETQREKARDKAWVTDSLLHHVMPRLSLLLFHLSIPSFLSFLSSTDCLKREAQGSK